MADILSYSFLAEFDILRDSRDNIRAKAWSNPSVRVIIEKYHRFVRAKEEIVCLNVELRRLRTWIRDEERAIWTVLKALRPTDPALAYELSRRLHLRQLVNMKIEKRLLTVERMNTFSGIAECGVGKYSVLSNAVFEEVVRPASPPADAGSDTSDEDTQERMDGLNVASERMVQRQA